MKPDPTRLLEMSDIKTPLIGFYDVSDTTPFEPFTIPKRCFFSSYREWCQGKSIRIAKNEARCQGGGYWIGGVVPGWVREAMRPDDEPREIFARELNRREGFKSSDELMCHWLENVKPYIIQNGHVVIGPLKDDQYGYLRTVTFYVNPDQLSLLFLGAEYNNASLKESPVTLAFGSGCGQMAALVGDLDTGIPRAVVGATDIAMRDNFPPDILAFTVNKSMYQQLCQLDENSFLYKHFWKRLREARGIIN